jgi:hypothetical protein
MEPSKFQNARDVVAFCKKNQGKEHATYRRPNERFIDTSI